jgi:histone H3/H4
VQAEFPTATKDMSLTEGALERLLKLSPRKVREALRDAVGLAVHANRLTIIAADIEDTPASSRIGF